MQTLLSKLKLYGVRKSIVFIAHELINRFYYQGILRSYSQRQEDLRIDAILGNKKGGFYVDIGAYDPHRFSNTKRFYNKGWSGINVEPDITNFNKFVKVRPRDINLNIGISEVSSNLTFYKFFPDTLSTFSKNEAEEYKKQGYEFVESILVKVDTLQSVLNQYAKGKGIDFFSIDTEGFDMTVLRSNDWTNFSPKVICIESITHTKQGSGTSLLSQQENFLTNLGYKKVFDNGLNSIYVLRSKENV